MKKTFILLALTALIPIMGWAQEDTVYKYWISLSDKAGCGYSLSQPEEYLSPRALERRQRLHITPDSLDLPIDETYVHQLQAIGFDVRYRSKWMNGVAAFTADSNLVRQLDSLPFVLSATLCDIGPATLPGDSLAGEWVAPISMDYDSLYGPEYYGLAIMQIDRLNGTMLHRNGYEGQGILIGVCDGGFPGVDTISYFNDLRNEGRLLATRDFVWGGDNVFNIHDHGTRVFSTMAAYKPGVLVGAAPRASYVLCRTENTLTESLLEEYNWIAAAEYLDSIGADIITSSLGYFYFDDSTMSHSLDDLDGRTAPMSRASTIAVSRGMVVLNAAGNSGESDPQYLNTPADAQEVLTVGACGLLGDYASFSSHGPTADDRIKPDVICLGVSVFCVNAFGVLTISNGTSLATPVMAGMTACLLQRYPTFSPGQICDSIRSWGSLADNPDMFSGYGIPDFGLALRGDTATIGIPLTADAPAMRLYPNPAQGQVHIQASEPCLVTLFDAMGRQVLQMQMNGSESSLPLNGLSKGLYFVAATTARGMATQKLAIR